MPFKKNEFQTLNSQQSSHSPPQPQLSKQSFQTCLPHLYLLQFIDEFPVEILQNFNVINNLLFVLQSI